MTDARSAAGECGTGPSSAHAGSVARAPQSPYTTAVPLALTISMPPPWPTLIVS